MNPDNHRIQLLPEYEIPSSLHVEIGRLLDLCFPDTFEGRTYYKQLPHFRLLAWQAGKLAGQLGIDSRVINIEGQVIKIFGIIDLCVHPQERGAGLATCLLSRAEEIARLHGRDHLVLMADRHDLYLKAGFTRVQPALTKWLAIDGRKSMGMIQRDLAECFLVKPLSPRPWPSGEIDLLGYLF